MKNFFALSLLLLLLPSAQPEPDNSTIPIPDQPAQNLVVITIDGVRWQEIFTGADQSLLSDTNFTSDTATFNLLYGAATETQRRQQLMPFFWNVLSKRGQLYGNRQFNNKVNTANIYSFSYPGYNEIFTGTTDLAISSNKKYNNQNRNVLEHLNGLPAFNGRVVAFTSWDVFPYILNEDRSGFPVNAGYELVDHDDATPVHARLNTTQDQCMSEKSGTRNDQLTFIAAKEYLKTNKPRVLFLGMGETDEFAHRGQYGDYLQQLNRIDAMIAELWQWIQSTPGYRNNTTLLITTDHGRGKKHSKWTSHSTFIRGSSDTWLAMIGPGLAALGERKDRQQLYQKQLAGVMAGLLGEVFSR